MNTEQLKTGKFRTWLKKNYGIQDFENYKNTQAEELAIQFASQESNKAVSEFKDKLKDELERVRDLYVGDPAITSAYDNCIKLIDLIDKL